MIGVKIKTLRKTLELTQAEFASKIGLKQNSIALIENGSRNISDQAVLSICREFNVNESWLRTGEGDMFCKDQDVISDLCDQYGVDEKGKVIIKRFVQMPEAKRQVIIEYMKKVSEDFLKMNDIERQTFDFSKLSDDEKVELYRQKLIEEKKLAEKSQA